MVRGKVYQDREFQVAAEVGFSAVKLKICSQPEAGNNRHLQRGSRRWPKPARSFAPQLPILSGMHVSMGLHGRPGMHREPLWPGGSFAAREGAENAVAKHEPVSTGTLDFFRGYNMDKVSNRPQGDSSGKLQILAKRESGNRDSQLKDFASYICFNPVLGH